MLTTAKKIIAFYRSLSFTGDLPPGVRIMNPVKESKQTAELLRQFYTKFFSDREQRYCVIGINPGRFGGGITGVPFTDPKRISADCAIPFEGKLSHEPSSAFIYEMISAFGGPELFYRKFFITAVCPLGFTMQSENGREVNYNYYDTPALEKAVKHFITDSIERQMGFLKTTVCVCLGTGKNEKYLRRLNEEKKYFKEIIALEHPRFIMQYKAKEKQQYVAKYLAALSAL